MIGVDISPEMIRLGTSRSRQILSASRASVGDAVTSPLGSFDLVTAVYLLPYATMQDQLLGMFRSVYANLVAGGRFIAYTDNPEFTLSKPNCTWGRMALPYCAWSPRRTDTSGEAEFVTDPPFRVRWYQWHQAPYEWALQEAGFRDFAWYPSEVAPEAWRAMGRRTGAIFTTTARSGWSAKVTWGTLLTAAVHPVDMTSHVKVSRKFCR